MICAAGRLHNSRPLEYRSPAFRFRPRTPFAKGVKSTFPGSMSKPNLKPVPNVCLHRMNGMKAGQVQEWPATDRLKM